MKTRFWKASLRLWQRRRDSRKAKWRHAQKTTPQGSPQRSRYYRLYREAVAKVAKRKHQLELARVTTVGEKGVRMIKSFEGFFAYPYDDYNDRPWSESQVGTKTIGYGLIPSDFPRGKFPTHMTEPQAARALREHLDADYAPAVAALKLPLTQDQFDALTSAVYNLGPGVIAPDTQVGKALRAHKWRRAANHLLDWDRANGVALPGLRRRRRAERKLFLTGKLDLS